MNDILSLLGLRRRILWNVLRTVGQHSRLKLLAITVLGGIIWVSLYIFPYYGFHWLVQLLREGTFSDLLVSLFFFLLSVMLVFSNAVIAHTALFRSSEAWFLGTCPVEPGTVFLYKLGESIAFSSWAFFFLGLPIMLAYGVHKVAPWYYYPAIPLFFFCFILIPASLGALVALAVSTFLRPWMRRLFTWTGLVFGIAALVIGPMYVGPRTQRMSLFMAPTVIRRVRFSNSVYWPSAWVSRGLAICAGSPGAERTSDAFYYLGLLASNSLLLTLVAYGFARRYYHRAWNRVHSSSPGVRFRRLSARLAAGGPRSALLNLILKDLKTFVRDPVQWTQCAVLFGLLGLYILNLRHMRYPSGQVMWRNITTFLNLGSICLVLATLTTRFVFPMFSLEGRRFWVLGLVPINRRYILWSKFLFSFTASFVITETLMVLSDIVLEEPGGFMVLHMATVGLVSLGLSGMSVGLSALFPNLAETSPAKIVSGFGGTLNLILSLFYVSVIVGVEAVPLHFWLTGLISHQKMVLGLCGAVGVLILLTALAFCIPMWLGSRALARMEF